MKMRSLFENIAMFTASVLVIAAIGYAARFLGMEIPHTQIWINGLALSMPKIWESSVRKLFYRKWETWDDVPRFLERGDTALELMNKARKFERGIL